MIGQDRIRQDMTDNLLFSTRYRSYLVRYTDRYIHSRRHKQISSTRRVCFNDHTPSLFTRTTQFFTCVNTYALMIVHVECILQTYSMNILVEHVLQNVSKEHIQKVLQHTFCRMMLRQYTQNAFCRIILQNAFNEIFTEGVLENAFYVYCCRIYEYKTFPQNDSRE